MHKEIPQLIQDGTLTPINELIIPTDEKDDFDKGFVFKYGALNMATQGFASQDLHNTSTERTTQRAEFSDYLKIPTKFKFPRIVRTLAICTK